MSRPAPITAVEQEVLDMLTVAASIGGKCPSNRAIADRIKWEASSISSLLRVIERKGKIRVERGQGKRIVTIVATGARTAGSILPPRPKSLPTVPRPVPQPVLVTERPEPTYAEPRDPCVCCGVRQDRHDELGCKRWRVA